MQEIVVNKAPPQKHIGIPVPKRRTGPGERQVDDPVPSKSAILTKKAHGLPEEESGDQYCRCSSMSEIFQLSSQAYSLCDATFVIGSGKVWRL